MRGEDQRRDGFRPSGGGLRDGRDPPAVAAVIGGREAAVAKAFQDEWGQVVATLIRVTGDWDLAEECAQDAFARALETWPRAGVPPPPVAWLTTTARNIAMDRLRRAKVGAAKLEEVAVLAPSESDDAETRDVIDVDD